MRPKAGFTQTIRGFPEFIPTLLLSEFDSISDKAILKGNHTIPVSQNHTVYRHRNLNFV